MSTTVVLYCIVLYCIVLYCIVLYCTWDVDDRHDVEEYHVFLDSVLLSQQRLLLEIAKCSQICMCPSDEVCTCEEVRMYVSQLNLCNHEMVLHQFASMLKIKMVVTEPDFNNSNKR